MTSIPLKHLILLILISLSPMGLIKMGKMAIIHLFSALLLTFKLTVTKNLNFTAAVREVFW